MASDQWLHISPMRPACHDGVIVANGHLYWGPWMCGCNLSLIGVIGLGPAGDFDYSTKAVESERLEVFVGGAVDVAPFDEQPDDWLKRGYVLGYYGKGENRFRPLGIDQDTYIYIPIPP